MTVIWGLDLQEIHYSKFKSSNMWNNKYHQRRTRFIVYQLAMICCVVSESLGTAVLSDYLDLQAFVSKLNPRATLHNNPLIGILSYNIFVGIYIATIFGAAFFFDLFWPERRESRAVTIAWRVCSVLACMFVVGDALALTEIVATRSAWVSGVGEAEGRALVDAYRGSPLRYRDNGRAIASVVFIWPGLLATFASTYLLWHSLAHIKQYGPKSKHARAGLDDEKSVEKHSIEDAAVAQPAAVHSRPEDAETHLV